MLRNFFKPGGSQSSGIRVLAEAARPSSENQRLIDEAARSIEPDDSSVDAWFQNYRTVQSERLAFDLGLVRDHARPGALVVDLGAVPPILCGAMAGLDYQVVGVDLAPERFGSTFDALGIRAVKANLETDTLPLDDASADTVILHEVFEHLRIDMIHTLEEIARILRPGGRLLLSTPNLLSATGVLNLVLKGRAQSLSTDPYREFSKLRTIGHMGHVREYTTLEVCEFLAHFGLKPTELVFRGRSKGLRGPLTRFVPRLRPYFELVAERRG